MSRLTTVLVLTLLVAAAGAAEDVPEKAVPFGKIPVVGLAPAVAAGLVSAGGEEPRSYTGVTLVLKNRTQSRRAIDVAGHYLRPRTRGSVQRLGLGPTVTPTDSVQRGPGSVVINLEPGETKRVELKTVCLDARRPAPRNHRFDAATDALPPVRVKVLRWWADHPGAPQGAVNSAIWQFRGEVIVPRGEMVPKGRHPALHSGTLYRLIDGALISSDPDGVERFLGTQIYRVFPGPSAVYAISIGPAQRPELWRLALTGGKPWSKVADIDGRETVFDVFSAGKQVVILTSLGAQVVSESGRRRLIVTGPDELVRISGFPARGGKVVLVTKERGAKGYWQGGEQKDKQSDTVFIRILDPKTGGVKVLKRFWNVKDAVVGPAGVFALSHGGALKVLAGKSFRALGAASEYASIVAVGRKHLWLATEDGDLVVVSAKSGGALHRLEKGARDLTGTSVDRVTGDLAAVRSGATVVIRAETGKVTEAETRDE